MKHLAHLNRYLLRYKWHLIAGFAFVALSNYFRVLQPQVIGEAINLVVDNLRIYKLVAGKVEGELLVATIGRLLLYFGGLVLLLALIMGIFMYFMRQTVIVASRLIEYDLRKDIFSHYENP